MTIENEPFAPVVATAHGFSESNVAFGPASMCTRVAARGFPAIIKEPEIVTFFVVLE